MYNTVVTVFIFSLHYTASLYRNVTGNHITGLSKHEKRGGGGGGGGGGGKKKKKRKKKTGKKNNNLATTHPSVTGQTPKCKPQERWIGAGDWNHRRLTCFQPEHLSLASVVRWEPAYSSC